MEFFYKILKMVEAEAWRNEYGGNIYTLYHLNRDFCFFIKAFYQVPMIIQ